MEAVRKDPNGRRIDVLVVEDDTLLRFSLAERLRKVGINVIEAANADEALLYLRANGPIDLVFTDIQMPGSLNGLQLADVLRAEISDTPIILTSGAIDPGELDALRVFIPKPYTLEEAVSRVFEQVGGPPIGGYT